MHVVVFLALLNMIVLVLESMDPSPENFMTGKSMWDNLKDIMVREAMVVSFGESQSNDTSSLNNKFWIIQIHLYWSVHGQYLMFFILIVPSFMHIGDITHCGQAEPI